MKYVTAYIKKDVIFNFKWVLVYIACTVFLSLYFAKNAVDIFAAPVMVFSLGTLTSVMFCVSRVCYHEDNEETKQFIKSLPTTYAVQIISRYIFTFILIMISNFISAGIYMICGYDGVGKMASLSIAFSLVFYMIFLSAFYFFGYQIAQYTFLFFAILVVLLQRTNLLHIENLTEHNLWFMAICVTLYFIVCIVSTQNKNILKILHKT